ncbi:MAG: HEPN domain-containing protein [Anaerolineales bacterium]|nr:HEPN domain-containing protein [Anaerolineales bacterium]
MKEHSRKLLTKAIDSIEAAELLVDRGKSDFAVGRAYFAMYYIAEALLEEKGLRFNKHNAVHAAYGKQFAETNRMDTKFHRWLLDAFDKMIAGDYGVDAKIERNDAAQVNRQAREFLGAAREYLERQ